MYGIRTKCADEPAPSLVNRDGAALSFPKRKSESILRLEKRKRDIGIYIVTEERMKDLRQTW